MPESVPHDPSLNEEERESIRQALGEPDRGRVISAIEEVERQVALEDLVLLLVDSAAGAAKAFLDSIVSLFPADRPPGDGANRGESE